MAVFGAVCLIYGAIVAQFIELRHCSGVARQNLSNLPLFF